MNVNVYAYLTCISKTFFLVSKICRHVHGGIHTTLDSNRSILVVAVEIWAQITHNLSDQENPPVFISSSECNDDSKRILGHSNKCLE